MNLGSPVAAGAGLQSGGTTGLRAEIKLGKFKTKLKDWVTLTIEIS